MSLKAMVTSRPAKKASYSFEKGAECTLATDDFIVVMVMVFQIYILRIKVNKIINLLR